VADAEALADVLADPAIGRFDVRTLVDRRSYELAEEIEAFFADRTRQDLLLLYISCHGVKDESGRLYFAANNTKLKRLAATGLSSSFVSEQMDRTRSRRVVLLLDCCYSGAFAKLLAKGTGAVDVTEVLQGSGRVVVTASSAMEYAFEGDRVAIDESSGSVFTTALVDGLSTGDADLDGDGRITVDELYDYVYERVRDITPNQTPGKIEHLHGELLIARTRAGPKVVAAPTPAPPMPAPPLPEPTPTPLPEPTPTPLPEPTPTPLPQPTRRLRWGGIAAALIAVFAAAAVVAGVLLPRGENGGGGNVITTPSPQPVRTLTPGIWQPATDLGVALESPGVAVLGGALWVIGGLSPDKGRPALDTVRVYDPARRTWRDGPTLPIPLDHAAVASDGSRIYVVGGQTGTEGGKRVSAETYQLDSPDDSTWARVTSARLPQPRAAGALAWDGRRLVFAGGFTLPDKAPHADVWALEDGQWRSIGRLSQAREHMAAASADSGEVWFVGGYDQRKSRELFGTVDIVDANGVRARRSTVPMRASAAAWVEGAGVCLFGGVTALGLVDDVACLQPDGGVREWPALPTARAGVGVAVLRDTVYVVGGFARGASGTTRVDAMPLSRG